MVWCEKNKDKWDNIIWGTREDNAASINLAKKNKFKKSGTYKKEDKEWHVYSYKK